MNLTLIEGKSELTANQLINLKGFKSKEYKLNCTLSELVNLYLSEGEIEGIRGDIAFAQACVETGYFKYGGIVNWDQNNYCGLGALDGNGSGKCATFETPQIGVRAHIQHLKAYCNNESLVNPCVDPRFKYVERGVSKYVEWLGIKENPKGKGWATGKDYGTKIISVLNMARNNDRGPIESPISKPSETELTPNKVKILFDGHLIDVSIVTINNADFIKIDDLSQRLIINKNSTSKRLEIITKGREILG